MTTDRWYDTPNRAAELITAAVQQAHRQHINRRRDDALFLRMYGQRDIFGAGESALSANSADRVTFNLLRAVVNTAAAHIGALRPKPKFQTNDADWTLSRRARKNEDAVRAVFYDQNYYALSNQVFVDAAVCSLGGVKVYRKDGKVRLERVYPGEILVDAGEAYYQDKHPNLYQVKMINKEMLKKAFPGHDHEIERSHSGDLNLFTWLEHEMSQDQVLVIEGWHLADAKGKGGKHTIAVRNGILYTEPWIRQNFPFAFYRWEKRQAGFYGMGIVEELRPAQRSLNKFDLRINEMMRNSMSKLVLSQGAKVNPEHLDNDSRNILLVANMGERPAIWAQNAVPPEWWQERQNIIDSAFLQIGVNKMQMSGEKPPGIQAAVALRELNDQGSKRFRIKVQDFEQFAIDTAKLIIQELREGAEKDDLKPVQTKTKKRSLTLIESVNWKEVALEDDEYRLEVQSASSLPDSTPGRIQTVQDWFSAGFINQQEAKQLLEFPDLEGFQSLDLAPYHVQLDNIETIIEDGEYVFPEPTDDLELALKLTTLSYSKYRLRNAPADRLELLLQYIDDVQHWQRQALEAASPAQRTAAQIAPAVAGLQQRIPGGPGGYEAARLLEAGAGVQQMGPGPGPGGPLGPGAPPGA